MAPRLNDTKAIVAIPLYDDKYCRGRAGERDTLRADPDGGKAFTTRRAQPGVMQYSYDKEINDVVGRARPHPTAGVESMKAAVGFLGKKVAESSCKMGKFRR